MKRLLMWTGLFAVGIAVLCCALSRDRGARAGEEKPDEKMKTIPLNSVHSTSRQEGLKLMDQGHGDEGFRNEMRELYQQSIKMGASNVFLARGDDIAAAVKATWEVFTQGLPVDEPASLNRHSKSEQYWLVAYLGMSGSAPPAWLVKSVHVSGLDIRLSFGNPGSTATDMHPYFVWVPVGKLKTGTYALHLLDAGEQHPALVRRVKVGAK
jgi:hypothetical protein